MTENNSVSDQLKEAIKEALVEVLHEQRDYLYDIFAEVVEDMGLADQKPEFPVSEIDIILQEDVFGIVEGQA